MQAPCWREPSGGGVRRRSAFGGCRARRRREPPCRPSRLQLGDGPYPHRRKKLYSYLTRVPDTSARGGQCRPTGWGSSPLPAPSSPPRCARHCRSEEHTSELQSLMRISYAVFCLKKKKKKQNKTH